MNRKVHNTLSALTASAALLVVGLIAAAPIMPGQAARPALTAAASPANDLGAARVLANAIEAAAVQGIRMDTTNDTPRSTGTTTRNRRQTLVMPYFSFLPRG